MGMISVLERVDGVTQLKVDGQAMLVLGGELGNSTASDLGRLDGAMGRCREMNLNTVLVPVYWDLIEREEGRFDFGLVVGAIELARKHGLRVVPLWFGTWKNSMSCYVPGWMKRDEKRFERVRRGDGSVEEIISPMSAAARACDARAFGALMRVIRERDEGRNTVVMVQVENEIGMIPEARDRSKAADQAFAGELPERLMRLLVAGGLGREVDELWKGAGGRKGGSWGEVFGVEARGEEVFSAWQFATYVEEVVAAGKREYGLPMFANAALIRPGYLPGQYPSAGPLPHLLEVWRAGAPSLEMICPDIYFPNFVEWCEKYDRNGNPVFVPEMAASMRASGNAVYVAGRHRAIGFAPFAIENVVGEPRRLIAESFRLLAGMEELVLRAQRSGEIVGMSPRIGFDWRVEGGADGAGGGGAGEGRSVAELGGVRIEARFDRSGGGGSTEATALPTLGVGRWDAPPGTPLGAAMVIRLGEEEFVVLGMGVRLTFEPVGEARGEKVGIEWVQEGEYVEGKWVGGRWLNGDETHQGRHLHLYDGRWSVQRFRVYRYRGGR